MFAVAARKTLWGIASLLEGLAILTIGAFLFAALTDIGMAHQEAPRLALNMFLTGLAFWGAGALCWFFEPTPEDWL